MKGTPPASLPGQAQATALLVLMVPMAAVVLLVFLSALPDPALLAIIYPVPLFLVAVLVLALVLARKGTAPVPPVLAWIGVAYIVGGAAFDILATLIHTPDLADEGNPFVLTLFRTGHSLWFVFGYGAAEQGLLVLFLCVLWIGLLRHRLVLIESLRGTTPYWTFLKSATGGARLTWRQWLLPLSLAELPNSYFVLWTLTAILMGGWGVRWYLGLEWFALVPMLRVPVAVVGVGLGLAVYFIWLWHASRGGEPG
jgi:hypothetical protein